LPCFLVEIDREKPAGLILQQRINADGVISNEVPTHHLVGQRSELPSLAVNLPAVLVFGAKIGLPVTHIARRCSPSELHKHRRARGRGSGTMRFVVQLSRQEYEHLAVRSL
jgi:predicted acylesterase/phospholipase RssA